MENRRIIGRKILLYFLYLSTFCSIVLSFLSLSSSYFFPQLLKDGIQWTIVFLIIVLSKLSPWAHLPNIRTSAILSWPAAPCQLPHRNLKLDILKTLAGYLSPLALLSPVPSISFKDYNSLSYPELKSYNHHSLLRMTNNSDLSRIEKNFRSGTVSTKIARVPGKLGLAPYSLFLLATMSNQPAICYISISTIFVKLVSFFYLV